MGRDRRARGEPRVTLLAYLTTVRGVRIHGERVADRARRVPTISFSVDDAAPEAIVRGVDPHGIGVRHGHFYAVRLVEDLGVAARGGVVRVSMVHYNTPGEVDRLIAALGSAIASARAP